MKDFFEKLRYLWIKATKPFRSFWLWVLLDAKQREAVWKQAITGKTQYVVVMNWNDVRVLDKQTYEYCREFIKKKYGKDLGRHVKWRATGTLQRNENYIPGLGEGKAM